MTHELNKKMSAFDLKITAQDVLPLKVFESKYFLEAINQVKLTKSICKDLKKLANTPSFCKAFMYLFWIFLGLKFRERTFGDMDHYNGKDEVS